MFATLQNHLDIEEIGVKKIIEHSIEGALHESIVIGDQPINM